MRSRSLCVVFAGIILAPAWSLAPAGPSADSEKGHGHGTPPDNIHWLEQQVVPVEDFEADGHVLAIGGGGECVIGQLKGPQAVAIDISERELEEAPGDALKIVMDARDLKFVDGSFDTAASFFTLMYIDPADHAAVFAEVHRVLRPGGRFLVWDAVLGPIPDATHEVVAVPLLVKLPDREIETGYGVAIPDRSLDLDHYRRLGLAAGFAVVTAREQNRWFYLEFRR